jgi:hypothetical protein
VLGRERETQEAGRCRLLSKYPRVSCQSPLQLDIGGELFDLLNDDSMMIAMRRDRIAGRQNPNHADYSYVRVGFLRDNLLALQEHRHQDPGHWCLIKTAIEVLFDYGASVERGLPGWERCDG